MIGLDAPAFVLWQWKQIRAAKEYAGVQEIYLAYPALP
jgi:hypothetical protein